MNDHNPSPLPRRRPRGFTLIELMIAVAVVAILAAIAMPSYRSYVQKSRRAEAKAALLGLAARQEKFMSTNNTYSATPTELGYAGSAFPVDVLVGSTANYRLSVSLGTDKMSYSATAVPTGDQSGDACGSYTLNQLGVQGNSGNSSDSASCW